MVMLNVKYIETRVDIGMMLPVPGPRPKRLVLLMSTLERCADELEKREYCKYIFDLQRMRKNIRLTFELTQVL